MLELLSQPALTPKKSKGTLQPHKWRRFARPESAWRTDLSFYLTKQPRTISGLLSTSDAHRLRVNHAMNKNGFSIRLNAAHLAILLASVINISAAERTEDFDKDPGWDAHNNRARIAPRTIRQDFG